MSKKNSKKRQEIKLRRDKVGILKRLEQFQGKHESPLPPQKLILSFLKNKTKISSE